MPKLSVRFYRIVTIAILLMAGAAVLSRSSPVVADGSKRNPVADNAVQKVQQGEQVFRFDTFGDEAFWGDTLKLHQAIEGSSLGGVGPGVSPKTALAAGLRVDLDALPSNLVQQILKGRVNLDDPAVTLTLLKLNAVVGLTGIFNSSGTLQSVGIQCALCHSTVDNSIPALCAGQITPNPGTGCIGHRLDGWPNRDLNVGAIVALAPDLTVLADLLSTNQATVRLRLRPRRHLSRVQGWGIFDRRNGEFSIGFDIGTRPQGQAPLPIVALLDFRLEFVIRHLEKRA